MDARSDIQVLKAKKIYRMVQRWKNRRPYARDHASDLVSSFLINQRTYTYDPEFLNRTVVKRLKEIGFFRMYPGKHNKRGDLIKQFGKQDVNASKELSRAGSGCINVDENFIKNINKYKPTYVIVIPDNNQLVDVKIVTFDTWTEKLAELGEKCAKSLISLFT
jgi:hypothetical protein